jgi:hypothetical protein
MRIIFIAVHGVKAPRIADEQVSIAGNSQCSVRVHVCDTSYTYERLDPSIDTRDVATAYQFPGNGRSHTELSGFNFGSFKLAPRHSDFSRDLWIAFQYQDLGLSRQNQGTFP